jgi:hypothetical protein
VMRRFIVSAPVVGRDSASGTGLSVATASGIVGELHDLRLLAETGRPASAADTRGTCSHPIGTVPGSVLRPALEGSRS